MKSDCYSMSDFIYYVDTAETCFYKTFVKIKWRFCFYKYHVLNAICFILGSPKLRLGGDLAPALLAAIWKNRLRHLLKLTVGPWAIRAPSWESLTNQTKRVAHNGMCTTSHDIFAIK